ncbi:MAG: thioredoxin family protein [Promethearchaeota archaeon]
MIIDFYFQIFFNQQTYLRESFLRRWTQIALTWADIKSETMFIDDYLKIFKDKAEIVKNYEKYKPKTKHLKHIKDFISKKHIKVKILAMGAQWCHDCAEQVPHMIKIVKELGAEYIDITMLYGIKVNVFRKEGEILWDKKHSPPEAVDPKFDLNAIPTFFIFKENELIGRIVERPKRFSTLERDLCNILNKCL